MDVPVPQILEEIVELVADERSSTTLVQASGDSTGGRARNPQEQNVEVIKVILQEQCQRMRFFLLLTACGKVAVGDTFHTCCPTAHPHTRGLMLSASDGIWNMLFSTCSHTSRWVRSRFGGRLSLVVAHVRPTHHFAFRVL